MTRDEKLELANLCELLGARLTIIEHSLPDRDARERCAEARKAFDAALDGYIVN